MKTISIALLAIIVISVIGAGSYMFINGNKLNTNTKQDTIVVPTSTVSDSENQQVYAMTDIASHNTKSDCWLVVEGKVYDVTSFISEHPGGDDILKGCGKDATSLFMSEREHAEENAASYLPQFQIGTVQ